jgi:hypothetical protein
MQSCTLNKKNRLNSGLVFCWTPRVPYADLASRDPLTVAGTAPTYGQGNGNTQSFRFVTGREQTGSSTLANNRIDKLFTATVLFRLAATNGYGHFQNANNNGGTYPYVFRCNGTGNKLQFQSSVNASLSIDGNTTLVAGTLYHAAVTLNLSTVTLYLNGKSDGTAGSSGASLTTTIPIYFGSDPSGTYNLNGDILSMRNYNRCLSLGEIAALYREELSGSWNLYGTKRRVGVAAATGNRRRRVICGAAA